uniref:Uncharacterized protein n=1 Tax=Eutreptiella gymnastica TaxID=73025 RepID=A0A7S1JCE2_9EUGL
MWGVAWLYHHEPSTQTTRTPPRRPPEGGQRVRSRRHAPHDHRTAARSCGHDTFRATAATHGCRSTNGTRRQACLGGAGPGPGRAPGAKSPAEAAHHNRTRPPATTDTRTHSDGR